MDGKIIPFLLLAEAIESQHKTIMQKHLDGRNETEKILHLAKETARTLFDEELFKLFLNLENAVNSYSLKLLKDFHTEREQNHKIYFAQSADGLIKIGRTTVSIEKRISQFKHISSGGATVIAVTSGSHKEETLLHHTFRKDKVHGEWFRPSRHLMDTIQRIKDGATIKEAVNYKF